MQENAGLRAQISQVMVERDDLEQRLNMVSYNYDKMVTITIEFQLNHYVMFQYACHELFNKSNVIN